MIHARLFCKPLQLQLQQRFISTTPIAFLKEIQIWKEGKKTIIEGIPVPFDRKEKLLNLDGFGNPEMKDPIRRLGIQLKHTDVLILSQFLHPDGSILPPNVTGLTQKSQYFIEMLIERARRAGILPLHISPDGKHVYYNGGPYRFNVYYDSDIVGLPKLKKVLPVYKKPT